MEFSAGILVYRFGKEGIEVLLGKLGGPKYDKLHVGVWNIPKGHIEENENPFSCALREFTEETSLAIQPNFCDKVLDLGESKTKTGKTVKIYAIEHDYVGPDQFQVNIRSNKVETEYPPKSGNMIMVPELSEAYYFKMSVAKRLIFSYQRVFLERLVSEIEKMDFTNHDTLEEQVEGVAVADASAVAATPVQTAGITGDSVFGSDGSWKDSLVKPKEKSSKDPGLTTTDIATIYSLTKNSKKHPVFRRHNHKK